MKIDLSGKNNIKHYIKIRTGYGVSFIMTDEGIKNECRK